MIIWQHKLESHVGFHDLLSICLQDFIVEDLMFWFNTLMFHAREGTVTCQNHFPLRFVLHWLHPSGIAVNVVE